MNSDPIEVDCLCACPKDQYNFITRWSHLVTYQHRKLLSFSSATINSTSASTHLTSHSSEDPGEDTEGWVYWFLYSSPKSMFGAPEPQSQTLTIQLNPSGDNFSVQPQATGKKITSFSAWMEAWNVYMAYRTHSTPHCPIPSSLPMYHYFC